MQPSLTNLLSLLATYPLPGPALAALVLALTIVATALTQLPPPGRRRPRREPRQQPRRPRPPGKRPRRR